MRRVAPGRGTPRRGDRREGSGRLARPDRGSPVDGGVRVLAVGRGDRLRTIQPVTSSAPSGRSDRSASDASTNRAPRLSISTWFPDGCRRPRRTSTFTGRTVPAAVVSIGTIRPDARAAETAAALPAALACEERASRLWASIFRGIASRASAVKLRSTTRRTSGPSVNRARKPTRTVPGGIGSSSSGRGGPTRSTMSTADADAAPGTTYAPDVTYPSSVKPAPSPAPARRARRSRARRGRRRPAASEQRAAHPQHAPWEHRSSPHLPSALEATLGAVIPRLARPKDPLPPSRVVLVPATWRRLRPPPARRCRQATGRRHRARAA